MRSFTLYFMPLFCYYKNFTMFKLFLILFFKVMKYLSLNPQTTSLITFYQVDGDTFLSNKPQLNKNLDNSKRCKDIIKEEGEK